MKFDLVDLQKERAQTLNTNDGALVIYREALLRVIIGIINAPVCISCIKSPMFISSKNNWCLYAIKSTSNFFVL